MAYPQRPPVPLPPVPGASGAFSTATKVGAGFVLGMATAFLLTIQVVPPNDEAAPGVTANSIVPVEGTPFPGANPDNPAGPTTPGAVALGTPGADPGTGGGTVGGSSGGGVQVGGTGPVGRGGRGGPSGQKAGLSCAPGKNGGATDTGVTGDKIRLAANIVTDGPGSNFLGDSPVGMEAVVRRVNNKEGGICGRKLELTTVNDSWDANRGRRNIEDFIKQGYFALPVVPSSEGLSAAIEAGLIEKAGIPVIGTDGMRKEQYDARGKASWVGPVAVATVSQVRIMAQYAFQRGARTFGIVYDQRYRFGVEGADAYEKFINDVLKKRDSSVQLRIRLPVQPGQSSYASEANQFKGACNPCDAVVLLLEPQTGISWMASTGAGGRGSVMTAGAQPLFNDRFARGCGEVCDGVLVWTGYNPAIGDANLSRPDIARYVSDVRAVNPSVDITNQFLEGAYLGMEVFVEILKACSPNLTRACVKERLNATTYTSDFASPLTWTAGDHFANKGARAYSIRYSQGSFSGFGDEQTGFIPDPTPGVVPD